MTRSAVRLAGWHKIRQDEGVRIIHTIAELRTELDAARSRGSDVGFAPTMGALHAGHASLMLAASRHDVSVVSIFVNPLQFAPGEDLDSYPRTLDADSELATEAGIEFVFAPSVNEVYPEENWTTVSLRVVTEPWEGVSRPTHFSGVATVVSKLFNIVGPCSAYFGEKDYQQLAMLRRMAVDLNYPVTVVGLPTVREDDGLAMSSRNRRLTPDHRDEAVVVNRSLRAGLEAIEAGERDPLVVEALVRREISKAAGASEPDYVAVVDAASLVVPERLEGEVRLLTAVKFGDVRLIDNMGITIE